ncbi:hypothetical protein PS2_021074 [Malus domestica]
MVVSWEKKGRSKKRELSWRRGKSKHVPLVRGKRVIRGGSDIVDGSVDDGKLKEVMETIQAREFGREEEPKVRWDKIGLGDTNLFAEIEKDFTAYGMNRGIYTADIGIKEGSIFALGKSGNPDVMNGLNMMIGNAAPQKVLDSPVEFYGTLHQAAQHGPADFVHTLISRVSDGQNATLRMLDMRQHSCLQGKVGYTRNPPHPGAEPSLCGYLAVEPPPSGLPVLQTFERSEKKPWRTRRIKRRSRLRTRARVNHRFHGYLGEDLVEQSIFSAENFAELSVRRNLEMVVVGWEPNFSFLGLNCGSLVEQSMLWALFY